MKYYAQFQILNHETQKLQSLGKSFDSIPDALIDLNSALAKTTEPAAPMFSITVHIVPTHIIREQWKTALKNPRTKKQ